MTKFLAFKAAQRVGMYVDTGSNTKVFWTGWCLESFYENVDVSSATRIIFDCNVSYG